MADAFDPMLAALITFADHGAPEDEAAPIWLSIRTTTQAFEGKLIGYAKYLHLYAQLIDDHPAWAGSTLIARLVRDAQEVQTIGPAHMRAQTGAVCFADVTFVNGGFTELWSVQAETIIGWRWIRRP